MQTLHTFFLATFFKNFCNNHEVPLTAPFLPASVPQILETLEEVPWSRFENLKMEPAVVSGYTDLPSPPNSDPLCCSDLFITSPTNPAVPLP